MKILFITMSRGSLIRNYFQTGIISKILDAGIRVIALSPNYDDEEIFGKYKHENLIFEPLHRSDKSFLDTLLMELGKGAIYSDTVKARYKSSYGGNAPRKILYYPRIVFYYFFRMFPGVFSILQELQFSLYPQTKHDYLFAKYNPDLVFITDCLDDRDAAVAKSAKRNNVRVMGMPKSWDNLSKFLIRFKLDEFLVWSDYVKAEAMNFQGYKPDNITVVGVPQHDYYSMENVISREEFCNSLGLKKEKKIIFYGSTGVATDKEADYIDLLLDFIDNEGIDAQILIRPHLAYKDDEKKFDKFKNHEKVVIFQNHQNFNLKDKWDLSDDHLKFLFNSFYHAAVSINIASTLTLDSVAVGTPSININFDINDLPPELSVSRYYKTDYIKAMAELKGIKTAKSIEEFQNLLKQVLVEDKGKELVQNIEPGYLLYLNDNQASLRVVDRILENIHQLSHNTQNNMQKSLSVKEILEKSKKSNEVGIVFRIWCFFSAHLTKLFLYTSLKPNHITLLSFIFWLIAGIFYYYNHFIIGSILFILYVSLDDVDGQVARIRQQFSKFGSWFDTLVGHLVYPYFFMMLGLGLYRYSGEDIFIIMGALGAVGKLVERSVNTVQLKTEDNQGNITAPKHGSAASLLKSLLNELAKTAVLFPIAFLLALVGKADIFLLAAASYVFIYSILKIIYSTYNSYKICR